MAASSRCRSGLTSRVVLESSKRQLDGCWRQTVLDRKSGEDWVQVPEWDTIQVVETPGDRRHGGAIDYWAGSARADPKTFFAASHPARSLGWSLKRTVFRPSIRRTTSMISRATASKSAWAPMWPRRPVSAVALEALNAATASPRSVRKAVRSRKRSECS